MIKQLVVIGTAVMTTLLALVALWQFRIVVVYVLISLALAATVRPFVIDWAKRGLVLRLALIFLYIVSLGSFGFLIFLVGRFAVGDIQQFAQTLSVQGTWVLPPWLEGSSFQHALVSWLPTPDKLFEAVTGEQGQLVLPAVLSFTEGIGGIVSGVFLVLFLSLYWSINQVHFERLWLSLLPAEQRKQARGIWRTIEPDLGAYIRSEIIQSLLAALLLGLGYWLLGSQYPALMALTGALAWLIPVVGAPLAIILPLLMGLLTSVQLSLFTILYTLVVLIALQVWVEPRLFKRKWDNPILTLIILLAMADAFGLLGILVAPPLSAVCQILWNLLVSNRLGSGAAVQVSDLKERQAHLWTVIKEFEEPPPPLVISSMERLANLLEKAAPILPAALPDPFHSSQPVSGEGGSPISTQS
ncbi:MAG: AI-2E family transporter [Anaerolineales bacterium]|nr:AI-2E family transporter [Anaerolineales bacterium]